MLSTHAFPAVARDGGKLGLATDRTTQPISRSMLSRKFCIHLKPIGDLTAR